MKCLRNLFLTRRSLAFLLAFCLGGLVLCFSSSSVSAVATPINYAIQEGTPFITSGTYLPVNLPHGVNPGSSTSLQYSFSVPVSSNILAVNFRVQNSFTTPYGELLFYEGIMSCSPEQGGNWTVIRTEDNYEYDYNNQFEFVFLSQSFTGQNNSTVSSVSSIACSLTLFNYGPENPVYPITWSSFDLVSFQSTSDPNTTWLQTLAQQNEYLSSQLDRIDASIRENNSVIIEGNEQAQDRYDEEKQEEADREEQSAAGSNQAITNIGLSLIFPAIGIFGYSDGCVSIPIIGQWLHLQNNQICPFFPANIRSALTPVIAIFSSILLFGFVWRWLNGVGIYG